jgi:uncharacterized membrane protein
LDVRGSLPNRMHAVLSYAAAAFVLAGVVLDASGLAAAETRLWAAGARLVAAGCVLAIPAALTGVAAQRSFPRTPARRSATVHGILTVAAVLLLALARWVRGHPEVRPDPPIFVAEVVAGVALLALLRRGRRHGGEEKRQFTAEDAEGAKN